MVISEVTPNSAASDAGLAPGTLIQQVNRQKVHNSEDFAAAFRSAKDKKSLLLLVSDGRNARFVTASLAIVDERLQKLERQCTRLKLDVIALLLMAGILGAAASRSVGPL